MGKKVIIAVFGGIAVLGLIFMIVGFALGGRPGSLTVRDGDVVYLTRNESVRVGSAPGWMRNWHFWGWPDRSPNSGTIAGGNTGSNTVTNEVLNFSAADMRALDIEISAGYVVIEPGDTLALKVDGPLEYETWFSDGTWYIESIHNGIVGRGGGFWLGGLDITTTLTITVPQSFDELDVDIGMGEAKVRGLTLNDMDCTSDMGTVTVTDCSATESDFTVNMGGITINGFTGQTTKLKCDMGSIKFEGGINRELSADCSMGSIKATLPRPAAYTADVDVSMGSIKLDGNKTGSGTYTNGDLTKLTDQSPHYDLECGMGSIDIDFN